MTDARTIRLARPPKPVSQMTDEELRAWAEQVGDAFAKAEGRGQEFTQRER